MTKLHEALETFEKSSLPGYWLCVTTLERLRTACRSVLWVWWKSVVQINQTFPNTDQKAGEEAEKEMVDI